MKLFAAALALTLGLAGCGPVDGDPIRSGASAPDNVPRQDAVTVAQLRQQAEQNGSLAAVLYLGSVPERTTDVHAVLDSLPEQPWQFVADIPADRWVTAPGGGRELYCIFAVRRRGYTFCLRKAGSPVPAPDGQGALLQAGWPAHSAAVQRQQGGHRHHGNGLLQHRTPAGLVARGFPPRPAALCRWRA